MDDYTHFGYDGKKPVPCSLRAHAIATAVTAVVRAENALDHAMTHVPDYTGQWSPEDYYATAQEHFYRTAELLEEALALPMEDTK